MSKFSFFFFLLAGSGWEESTIREFFLISTECCTYLSVFIDKLMLFSYSCSLLFYSPEKKMLVDERDLKSELCRAQGAMLKCWEEGELEYFSLSHSHTHRPEVRSSPEGSHHTRACILKSQKEGTCDILPLKPSTTHSLHVLPDPLTSSLPF